MKEFLAYIVKNLVDNPDDLTITEINGTHTLIIELCIPTQDLGKIIGKQGKMIKAIRALLIAVASRHNIRINLEVIEKKGVHRDQPHRRS